LKEGEGYLHLSIAFEISFNQKYILQQDKMYLPVWGMEKRKSELPLKKTHCSYIYKESFIFEFLRGYYFGKKNNFIISMLFIYVHTVLSFCQPYLG
jgi:hypothetical protein